MASLEGSVNVNQVMRNVTMTITLRGVKTFKFRLWLGGKLLALAGRVIGCGIQIENEITPVKTTPPDIGADVPGGGAW